MRGYERDEEDDEEIDIGRFLLVYVSYAFLMSISMRCLGKGKIEVEKGAGK